MIGTAELLGDTDLQPAQQDHLAAIHESAAALLDIINDILDFSKIEAGRLQSEHHRFRLRERLDNLVKSLAPRLHGRPVALSCDVADEAPDTLCEVAHAAARTRDVQFGPYQQHVAKRRGTGRAAVATAHKTVERSRIVTGPMFRRAIRSAIDSLSPHADRKAPQTQLAGRRTAPLGPTSLRILVGTTTADVRPAFRGTPGRTPAGTGPEARRPRSRSACPAGGVRLGAV